MQNPASSPSLRISECVIRKLESITECCTGKLYGLFFKNTLLIIGAHFQEHDTEDIILSFPTEIDQCGAFKVTHERIQETEATDMIQDILVTDNPLYLHKIIGNKHDVVAYHVINDHMQKVEYTVATENEIYGDIMHLRLKTTVPLICELNQDSVIEGIKQLTNNMAMGLVAFNIDKTNIYILNSENSSGIGNNGVSGTGSNGISGTGSSGDNVRIGDVCENLKKEDRDGEIKKKKSELSEVDVLTVNMFKKSTIEPYSEAIKKHAPIVHVDKRMDQMLLMALELDCLTMVHRKTKISRLYDILVESAYRNLKLIQGLLLKDFEESRGDQPPPLSVPEVFHFLPQGVGHFITRVYDKKKTDEELIEERKILHKQFHLPTKQPIFRRANKYYFKGESPCPGKLINPHETVKPTNNGGQISLVQGKYAYYHYRQDKMDDDGWGCAYRSLQTLASWLLMNGYTSKDVPTFKDIQTCLVDIGDKPIKFIGSSQWIGSTEVNFVLSSLLNIDCKILYCSSGTEVANQGPDLEHHFRTNGSPIMIGGGVLAHTILGVDYNHETGDIKFLILDPHYTGGEDLQVIQKKGWCGWKGVDFWDKKSYYNMCLPQIPRCI